MTKKNVVLFKTVLEYLINVNIIGNFLKKTNVMIK